MDCESVAVKVILISYSSQVPKQFSDNSPARHYATSCAVEPLG